MKKVFIYEGMNWHGECLSSYYSYFTELGYEVTFAICESRASEYPLWMIKNAKIYTFTNPTSRNSILFKKHENELIAKIPDLFEYDIYFICTMLSDSYEFVKSLYRHGVGRNKILHQNHRDYNTFLHWTNNDVSLAKNGFVLGIDKQKHFSQLSPIKNETKMEHPKLEKNLDTINIFIGGLAKIHFKNFEKLVAETEKLNKEGYKINIDVTGIRQKGNYVLPNSEYVNYLGRLGFKEIAEKYCTSDFLFVLFDEKPLTPGAIAEEKTFLTGRVSGSRNMSIMYKIPLVVQKPFQLSWDLNDDNSIGFSGNDYKKVLLDLCNMKKEKYNNIIEELQIKEQKEFQKCLNNLKNKISALETNTYKNNPVLIYNNYSINVQSKRKKKNFINF